MMKKKIIVFGATGDTGSYFIDYLTNDIKTEQFEIIASGSRDTDQFDKIGIQYIKLDITKKSDYNKLPKDVFAVVHLAGYMPARMEGYDPYKYIDVNINGTLNILEYCRENHVDRVLYAQSFGDIKDYSEENILLKPDMQRNFSFKTDHTVYVMTKNFAVDLIKNYNEMYNIKGFIFRLPTIYLYSPIDHYYVDGKKRKIGYRILIDRAINGEDIEVWGDYSRQKDMVYVKDFAQMLYKSLLVDKNFGHYNVGTGVGTSLIDQINGIIEVFSSKEKKSKLVFCKDKPNAPQYIMDIENAKKDLGYKPKYNYIDMLIDFKKYMDLDKNKEGKSKNG